MDHVSEWQKAIVLCFKMFNNMLYALKTSDYSFNDSEGRCLILWL